MALSKERRVLLSEMTWEDMEAIKRDTAVMIFPVGSTEQHGYHLPLETDNRIIYELAKSAAQKVSDQIAAVVAPPITVGISSHHLDFPGTLSLNSRVFIDMMVDLCRCAVYHKFRRILLLNGHGGNHAALQVVARLVKDEADVIVAVVNYWNLAAEEIKRIRESEIGGIAHAGEFETSLMMILRPELVKEDRLVKEIHTPSTRMVSRDMLVKAPVSVAEDWSDITKSGVWGDPTLASREKGERLLKILIDRLASLLQESSTWDIGRI